MCKVSRCNSTKLEAIQARYHTQHATTYNSAKLEKTPMIGGWNMYEKRQAEGISTKLEEMKARHHMNMQPISVYQVKSVSS